MQDNVVLTLSWSDYEKRKMSENSDVHTFCPEYPWELTYLIRKIRELYNQYSDTAIFTSIRDAARSVPAPRERSAFVRHVLQNLSRQQPAW